MGAKSFRKVCAEFGWTVNYARQNGDIGVIAAFIDEDDANQFLGSMAGLTGGAFAKEVRDIRVEVEDE